jgi:hypothetical protein
MLCQIETDEQVVGRADRLIPPIVVDCRRPVLGFATLRRTLPV